MLGGNAYESIPGKGYFAFSLFKMESSIRMYQIIYLSLSVCVLVQVIILNTENYFFTKTGNYFICDVSISDEVRE